MRHGLSSKPSMSCTTILRWARSTSLMNSFTAGIMSEAAPLRIAHTSCPGNLYTFSTSPMRVPSAVTTEHPMISWTKYDPFFSFTDESPVCGDDGTSDDIMDKIRSLLQLYRPALFDEQVAADKRLVFCP